MVSMGFGPVQNLDFEVKIESSLPWTAIQEIVILGGGSRNLSGERSLPRPSPAAAGTIGGRRMSAQLHSRETIHFSPVGQFRRGTFMARYWRILHPFLWASISVLTTYANNLQDCRAGDLMRPLLVLGAAAGTLLLWHCLLLRDTVKASVLTSLAILYVAYHVQVAHVYSLIVPVSMLFSVWLLGGFVGYIAAIVFLCRTKRGFQPAASLLTILALGMLVLPAWKIATGATRPRALPGLSKDVLGPPLAGRSPGDMPPPDIYYLVPDGYARHDTLQEIFGYDNSEFLDALRARGFYIAEQSRSNYCQTGLSLTSSLNLEYLDPLVAKVDPQNDGLHALLNVFPRNRLRAFLEAQGYEIIATYTNWWLSEWRDADLYLKPPHTLNELEAVLLDGSVLGPPLRASRTWSPHVLHYETIMHALASLPEVARRGPAPKFVFCHLVSPHPPFVMDEHGQLTVPRTNFQLMDQATEAGAWGVTHDEYRVGYRQQVSGLSQRLIGVIDAILANSSRPPIILIQADHGSGLGLSLTSVQRTNLRERFAILNAYYLPGADTKQLYPQITPVNTFRVVLNAYFSADLPLLPDRSFYSTWPRPFQFIDVTDRLDAADRKTGNQVDRGRDGG